MTAAGDIATQVVIFLCALAGVGFAVYQFFRIRKIPVIVENNELQDVVSGDSLVMHGDGHGGDNQQHLISQDKLFSIHRAISVGANSFLRAEYLICCAFMVVFGLIVVVLVGVAGNCAKIPADTSWNVTANPVLVNGTFVDGVDLSCWGNGGLTALSFVLGATTSMVSGWIGMTVAVYTNLRTAISAQRGWNPAFTAAFRGGAVMGFALSGLGLFVLLLVIIIMKAHFQNFRYFDEEGHEVSYFVILYEVVTGYGLGGSTIALFGRVGGGIYTKAADVGADLVGKVELGIPEDDPRNPATIADNVGDNVGDVAGMGADLFGSFAESTCAALAIASTSPQIRASFAYTIFPLVVSAFGIIVCIATTFVATTIWPVREERDVEKVLKMQLVISTVALTVLLSAACGIFLPGTFCFETLGAAQGMECVLEGDIPASIQVHWWGVYICTLLGLWAGLFTGLITEYYTSHSYRPVREVAGACDTGAATNVIYGLALGYKSTVAPVILLGFSIFGSFQLAGMYGVALAALGMLSSMATGLTIDAYGPITDNAGGIAEMGNLGADVREITDGLDAAGNTTAAIGKGFAIGSAALVSLALFSAYVTRIGSVDVNLLKPIILSFVVIGAMLPYWFSAMTIKSVGIAAQAMVIEVREQFENIPGLMDGTADPDYERCVQIATKASLKEMIAPGCLVIFTPILVGSLFGVHALTGLLVGAIASAIQMALSASNTGGAWDNAKKYIEKGNHGGKGSDAHKAAVVGDTVGDPLKDTSGPALNILMKLMAIISLVFADFFAEKAATKGAEWAGY